MSILFANYFSGQYQCGGPRASPTRAAGKRYTSCQDLAASWSSTETIVPRSDYAMGKRLEDVSLIWPIQEKFSAFWALVVSQERGKRARNQGGIKDM